MQINFIPQGNRGDSLSVSRAGEVLTINGDTLDVSVLPDGAMIKDGSVLHPLLAAGQPITRRNGEIDITFLLPFAGTNPSQAVAFPEPLIDPPDGPLAIPFDTPPAEPEIEEEEPTDGGN